MPFKLVEIIKKVVLISVYIGRLNQLCNKIRVYACKTVRFWKFSFPLWFDMQHIICQNENPLLNQAPGSIYLYSVYQIRESFWNPKIENKLRLYFWILFMAFLNQSEFKSKGLTLFISLIPQSLFFNVQEIRVPIKIS